MGNSKKSSSLFGARAANPRDAAFRNLAQAAKYRKAGNKHGARIFLHMAKNLRSQSGKLPESAMNFIVIENFSEKVDKKARASRLLRVKQAVGKQTRLAQKQKAKSSAWSKAFKGAKKVGKAGSIFGGGRAQLASMRSSRHHAKAAHGKEILHRFRAGRKGRKPYVAARKARAGKRYYKGIVKGLKQRGYDK